MILFYGAFPYRVLAVFHNLITCINIRIPITQKRKGEGRKRTLTHFYNNLLLLINTFVIVVAASQVCHSFNHSFVHFYSPLLFLSPSRNLSDIISIGHFTSHHHHNKFKLKFEWYSKLFGPSYTSCSSLKGLTFSVFLSRSSSLWLSELTTF